MTIDNIAIYSDYSNRIICKATLTSKDWKYCNNIVYWCDLNKWVSDYYTLPASQKVSVPSRGTGFLIPYFVSTDFTDL